MDILKNSNNINTHSFEKSDWLINFWKYVIAKQTWEGKKAYLTVPTDDLLLGHLHAQWWPSLGQLFIYETGTWGV